jgi:hypothetical protein
MKVLALLVAPYKPRTRAKALIIELIKMSLLAAASKGGI